MQNQIIIYLTNNKILIYKKKEKEVIECSLSKKILENGKIIHRPKFTREFLYFIKKNHLLKPFRKNKLCVIVPPNFNEVDKEIWNRIFEDTSFQEIKYIKEINLYELKKNVLWINLNDEYAYFIYQKQQQKEFKIIYSNYLGKDYIEQIKDFLKLYKNIKKIYVIGNINQMDQICKKLEKETKKIILYYANPKEYLLKRHNII